MKIKQDITAEEFSAMEPIDRLKNLRRIGPREYSKYRVHFSDDFSCDRDEEFLKVLERLSPSLTDEEWIAEVKKIEAEETEQRKKNSQNK